MSKLLESPPSSWKYFLLPTSVPKNGTPIKDSISLNVELPISYWSQIYEFSDEIKVDIEVVRTYERLIVAISVFGETEMPCSRCLELAKVQINSNLKYIFSLKPSRDDHEEDDVDRDMQEDFIVLETWDEKIDLIPLVWETLLSALPAVEFCSKECKGLCPNCGENLNKTTCNCKMEEGDPRFDILRPLIKKENKKLEKN